MFCFCFLFIFDDFCQTSYLKICPTDLFQFSGLLELAIDDQSEIGFSILQGTLPRQRIFVGFILKSTRDVYFCGFIHVTDSLDAGG